MIGIITCLLYTSVEHAAPDHADEFRLGVPPFLEMEAPQHAVAWVRFVVLHEAHGTDLCVETALRVALEEVAPRVAENLRLKDNHAFYGRCLLYTSHDDKLIFVQVLPRAGLNSRNDSIYRIVTVFI